MSVDTLVFLRDDKLPTVEEWQDALDRADVGVVLEPIDDLRAHEGYVPALHRGEESGFEWFYGPRDDWYGGELREGLGDRSHVALLVTHGDMREFICAMVAASVLAGLADGRMFDEQEQSLIDGKAALAIALGIEDEEF